LRRKGFQPLAAAISTSTKGHHNLSGTFNHYFISPSRFSAMIWPLLAVSQNHSARRCEPMVLDHGILAPPTLSCEMLRTMPL
jgi:hypothetical protein